MTSVSWCGKDTSGGRGFMTLHVDSRPVPICCPHCYQSYEKDPVRYLSDQKARSIERELGAETQC